MANPTRSGINTFTGCDAHLRQEPEWISEEQHDPHRGLKVFHQTLSALFPMRHPTRECGLASTLHPLSVVRAPDTVALDVFSGYRVAFPLHTRHITSALPRYL